MKTLLSLLFLSSFVSATSIERVIEKSEPKVVKIGIVAAKTRGVCSGEFITDTGIVLTCAHCFGEKDIKKVFIKTSEGRVFPAQPLYIDSKVDLALIAPQTYEGKFPYFRLGEMPKVGQQVISMGSPLGIQHTATVGYASNIVTELYTYVFHSAFISPGNSGGPLLNLDGKLIGVNEAVIVYGFLGLEVAQGLDVAISLKTIKAFLGRK